MCCGTFCAQSLDQMATAQQTALAQNVEMEVESSESAPLALFRSSFGRLALLLEAELLSVSTAAFGEALIDIDLLTAVSEKKVYNTAQSQTLELLTTLYRKMRDKPAEAQRIMEKFITMLAREAAYDGVREVLREYIIGKHFLVYFLTFMYVHNRHTNYTHMY